MLDFQNLSRRIGAPPVYPVRIKQSHPLAADLLDAWLFSNGNRDSLLGTNLTSGAAKVRGDHLFLNGTTDEAVYSDAQTRDRYDGLTKFSVVMDIDINALPASDAGLFAKLTSTFTGVYFYIDTVGANGTNVLDMVVYDGASNSERSSPATSIATGRHTVIGTADFSRPIADVCKSYVDGVNVSSSTEEGGNPSNIGTTTAAISIGTRTEHGTKKFFDGKVYLCLTFKRALSAEWARIMSADPYQIFEPAVPVYVANAPAAEASAGGFFHRLGLR